MNKVQNSDSWTNIGLLILRLGLGVIFFAHGGQKVMGWWGGPGLSGTVDFMGSMGIPAPLAILAAFTEFLGGMALIVGLFSRLAAAGLAVTMIVAMSKVHLANGFFLGGMKPGIEFTLALFVMALTVITLGPGRFAIADFEGKFFVKKS